MKFVFIKTQIQLLLIKKIAKLSNNCEIKKGLHINVTLCFYWWPLCESNTAPTDYESAALTKHELRGRKQNYSVLIVTRF